MMTAVRNLPVRRNLVAIFTVTAVLLLAALFGRYASLRWFLLLAGAGAGVLLLLKPALGLPALIVVSLVGPFTIGTGTEVRLNLASLLVPILLGVWALTYLAQRGRRVTTARVFIPFGLFLAENVLSLLVGNATWATSVPRPANFTLVQLAQCALFAFSGGIMWLSANLNRTERAWRICLWTFAILGGGLAVLSAVPGLSNLAQRIATLALTRSPFWLLLAGLAAGQLLYNKDLGRVARIWLAVVLLAVIVFVFTVGRESVSTWLGVVVTLVVLVWLRFPRLRLAALAVVVALLLAGQLYPALYDLAGGEQEARSSGESRLALSGRVVEVTMRNPITGLGPAAYRPYTRMQPMAFYKAYWLEPNISAHNNYVDLFAHGGIIAVGLFLWFAAEYARLGIRLGARYRSGFAGGLRASMLAVGAASLVIMLLADWILPFVYNIGFDGFQASVLVWLFAGALVALDNAPLTTPSPGTNDA